MGSIRFRPAQRLSRATGFSNVFAGRKVIRGSHFDLYFLGNGLGSARLGLAISKRNLRRAVQRNRFKRVAREVFRHTQAQLPGLDLVLRLARPVRDPSSDNGALREDIVRLLSRLPNGVPG